jgi:hypothetical protein
MTVFTFYRIVALGAAGLSVASLGAREVQADYKDLPDHG